MTDATTPWTKEPWSREHLVVWAPQAKAVIAKASALRASNVVVFTETEIGDPDLDEIVANAERITTAVNALAGVVGPKCLTCQGSGVVDISSPGVDEHDDCFACNGTGRQPLGSVKALVEAARRVLAVAPTVIEPISVCKHCVDGTVNIGTPMDPEPGPCPYCCCEIHQERHKSCVDLLRDALAGFEAVE